MKISFEEYQQSASYTQLCGHRIAHWQSGARDESKESILMIHGFPSAAWDWHYQWINLAKADQVITLDMLGFGLSDKPKTHCYSLIEQADIITALLENKGIKSCHILAHDYGNSVAQELLSRHEANKLSFRISSLCYLNGGLFADYHRPLRSQKLLKSPFGWVLSRLMGKASLKKSFTQIFGPNTPPLEEDLDILWRLLSLNDGQRVLPGLLQYIDERHVHGEGWIRSMQSTQVPLYFINGVHDPISGQHMLDRYREIIPNPHTTALDVGHYPQLEAPEQVLSLYQAFVKLHKSKAGLLKE
ncbi:MAG: pimeloyl-ACP methyl ester carboxylesterase [Paraglaciecola sp.]|jgi:pimeloyl-ACP methyl ester carboxylesterase